jgi:hypothetical protein
MLFALSQAGMKVVEAARYQVQPVPRGGFGGRSRGGWATGDRPPEKEGREP